MLWWYARLRLTIWLLRVTGPVLSFVLAAVMLIAAAPVTIVTALAYAGAWLRGWPPARLRRAVVAADDRRLPRDHRRRRAGVAGRGRGARGGLARRPACDRVR